MRIRTLVLLFLLVAGSGVAPIYTDWVFLSTINRNQYGDLLTGGLYFARPEWAYTSPFGSILIYKSVPLSGLMWAPSGDRVVFVTRGALAWWDGTERTGNDPNPAYREIANIGGALSEISPVRSGNFLVAERWTTEERVARLFEFNLDGIVRTWELPRVFDWSTGRSAGARHLELLGDQCTLLYSHGEDSVVPDRVRRFDICRGVPMPDFVTLHKGLFAGTIRQLRDGNVLIASADGAHEYAPSGVELRLYSAPNSGRLALNSRGSEFWLGGAEDGHGYALRYELGRPWYQLQRLEVNNPGSNPLYPTVGIDAVAVVGEWRASAAPRSGRDRVFRGN